jgi:tetratricopeptide (TPR) repeat protein
MAGSAMAGSAATLHADVVRRMQARDWQSADAACRHLLEQFPAFGPGWAAASHIALALGAPDRALTAIEQALSLEPANAAGVLHRAMCLLALQRRAEALEAADAAARAAPSNPGLQDAVGTLCSRAEDHRRALAAYDRAVTLAPQDPRFRFNRASVRRFIGDLAGAEEDYDFVIAKQPDDFEAYYNRSELRVQTAERNHVAALETVAARHFADWRGEVQVSYALAKELEDLGDYPASFAALKRGADLRRRHMRYDVAHDVATVDWIIEAFPGAAPPPAAVPGKVAAPPPAAVPAPAAPPQPVRAPSLAPPSDRPIFIVGLPRSGTTLVERILGSHSTVTSAGELNAFALALVDAVRAKAGRILPRRELVAASATLDFAALGHDYLRRARASFAGDGRFIDKMPLNYLYCGLIRQALPQSTIIHLTRHPLAVGYAMYKTLFKDGYPFSYDLNDIARYYAAYAKLMDHWRRTLPGAIYDVGYEAIVADQRGETEKLLAHCGLDWEEACAEFHRNPSASTTASASQVRRPLYETSVAQWRHYETELAPLAEALRDHL